MAYVISNDCVACGTCIDECPVGAISEGDIYKINPVGNLLGLIALARLARYQLVFAIVGYLPVSVALTGEPASELCTVSLLQT